MWLLLGFGSALLLGAYDVCKKISLQNNAVIPVLFVSIVISSLILLPFLLVSRFQPAVIAGSIFYVPQVDLRTHLFILLKSVIVLTSWIFSYFGLKHLPITLATPISATRPMWTVLGAVLLFGEQLNLYQAVGIAIALISFFMFSVVGKKEGFSFTTNKWFWFIVLATLAGAASGLYDKYLMRQYDHMAVQVYYTFYQAAIMALITMFMWRPTRKKTTPFQFRWSIVLISVFLVAADFLYFYALTMPDSLISVLSTIRRLGVIVAFLYGAIVLHDKNVKLKVVCLLGVLLGMLFLFLGSR
ncbi:EamA family transporter [Paludibacter sp. 221]|uniref:DMT family transporter n=1 Tax=Paludibacter sp. 221 TaxID=2302939 RepID=UPI0013D78B7D|nr:DMT family transporter [Paludibacter sp. 221]NDV46813.1 EamA family transporter [Paludibacter sp. 221]